MSLTQLFDRERETLQQRISADPTPDKVVKATRECLDSVNFAYHETDTMEPFRQRLAATLIELVKGAVSSQADTYIAQVWVRNHPAAPTSTRKSSIPVWRLLELVMVATLGGYMFYNHAMPYLYGLGALTVTELIRTLLAYGQSKESLDHGNPASDVKASIQIDGERLIMQVNQMMIAADKILNESAAAMEQIKQEYAPQPNQALLDFYQDLLEASQFGDGQFALKRIRVLPQLLRAEGIAVVEFAEPSQKRFDLAPSLTSERTMVRTLRPALVKGEVTLRRGLVEIPQETHGGQTAVREVQ